MTLNRPLKWDTCWRLWKWLVQLQPSFLIQWELQAGHYSLCDTVCGISVSGLGWSGWSYIELHTLCTPKLWLVKAEGPTILKNISGTAIKSSKILCTALDTVFQIMKIILNSYTAVTSLSPSSYYRNILNALLESSYEATGSFFTK